MVLSGWHKVRSNRKLTMAHAGTADWRSSRRSSAVRLASELGCAWQMLKV